MVSLTSGNAATCIWSYGNFIMGHVFEQDYSCMSHRFKYKSDLVERCTEVHNYFTIFRN